MVSCYPVLLVVREECVIDSVIYSELKTDYLLTCQWPFGGVKGYWIVDFDEPDCLPIWGKFTDMVRKSNFTNESLLDTSQSGVCQPGNKTTGSFGGFDIPKTNSLIEGYF